MRRAFTLIEMLVVMGIIAILTGAMMATYSGVVARAQSARAQELVSNVQTALVQIFQENETWPRALLAEGSSGKGELTEEAGAPLAKHRALALTARTVEENGNTRYVLTGLDKFGIVDPWAAEVIKSRLKKGGVSLMTPVPAGGTVRDHRLRFAVDDDLDGLVKVSGDGISATIRASAVVWGAGRDGRFGTKDDLRSWASGQEVK